MPNKIRQAGTLLNLRRRLPARQETFGSVAVAKRKRAA
jgi:hypothetical protein